jgi:hypothetical protein
MGERALSQPEENATAAARLIKRNGTVRALGGRSSRRQRLEDPE